MDILFYLALSTLSSEHCDLYHKSFNKIYMCVQLYTIHISVYEYYTQLFLLLI